MVQKAAGFEGGPAIVVYHATTPDLLAYITICLRLGPGEKWVPPMPCYRELALQRGDSRYVLLVLVAFLECAAFLMLFRPRKFKAAYSRGGISN